MHGFVLELKLKLNCTIALLELKLRLEFVELEFYLLYNKLIIRT